VAKAEQIPGKENPRYVVTSLPVAAWPTQQLYCARGEMENRIKGAPAKPAKSRWCKSTALKGVANHSGLEACAVDRKADGEALSEVRIGQPSSRENDLCSEC
jgi:hypothetical protein